MSGLPTYGGLIRLLTRNKFSKFIFGGSTSGQTTLQASAVAGSTTLTLPAVTDTLVGKTTTDTLTNKTLTNPVVTGITISSVVAAQTGTFTCNGATPVTVANTAVTANSAIIPTLKTVGGTVGATPAVKTITAGTGFTIAGTALDTSVYNYTIIG